MASGFRPAPLASASLGLHAAALLALTFSGGSWPWVAGAVFANHLVLAAASLAPRSSLLGGNLTRLSPAAAARGEVALTFDDGPDPEVTPRVLDLLAQAGARATFFPIGARAAAHPDLVREIVRRGHRVENHTQTHPNLFACFPAPLLAREVGAAQATLAALSGRTPRLFRAPAGMRNPFLDWVLHRQGLRLVSWTRRGFDTVDRRPERIVRRLATGLAPGDILLLHDGSAARTPGGEPVVLEVLSPLLAMLAHRGLRSTALESEGPE